MLTSIAASSGRSFAGELLNPRGCYICKNDYTLVDAFYHWLCPACAAKSHTKRDQGTDLTGRRALGRCRQRRKGMTRPWPPGSMPRWPWRRFA